MPEEVIRELGITLKNHRKEQDLTQDDLADLTGISKRHIANIEKGIANASFEIVAILAKQLSISLDKIVHSSKIEIEEQVIKELALKLSDCTEEQKQLVIKLINCLLNEMIVINQNNQKD